MRDIILSAFIIGVLPFALRRPWIGVMLWTWVSVMSPHRLTWGFAWNQPWAAVIAATTLLGVLFSSDRKSFPFTPVTVLLILIPVWMTVTSLFALEPMFVWSMWEKVFKIFFMFLITLLVLHTRRHIEIFVWITVGSIAFYGIKGGLFTLNVGGGERVYGPGGSYIEENNALAVAIVMCIPLLNYIRMTVTRRWVSMAMLPSMALCALSVIGSHSRGALLAIVAMAMVLWWRGKSKFLGLVVMVSLAIGLVAFAPEKWEQRMGTIDTHEDYSAQGRLNAWGMAWNLALDRPLVGGGFDCFVPASFARWGPVADMVQGAHSVYFQMLGEHGFPGLLMYLGLLFATWRLSAWIRKRAKDEPDFQWAYWLASMSQVSFVGFMVGGAFLNLAYWDVPYNLMAALVLTRVLMEKELAKGKVEAVRGALSGRGRGVHGTAVPRQPA